MTLEPAHVLGEGGSGGRGGEDGALDAMDASCTHALPLGVADAWRSQKHRGSRSNEAGH